MQNSPRHHIAQRKLAHGVILGHEAMHFKIAQVSALAPQRVRKQKSRGILKIESRRMKLDKLHVADFGAGAKRHSNAICPVSPLLFMRWTPWSWPSSMQRSVVNSNSQTETCFNVFALATRARRISRPVESPWACRMRLRLCASSRPNVSFVPSRPNSVPH